VEKTLNAMLDEEADRLRRTERYEWTKVRKDTRAGSYQRQLHTKAGEVTFGLPAGEPSITTRATPQQMCEKLWTLLLEQIWLGSREKI
jgi:hypothetical protein